MKLLLALISFMMVGGCLPEWDEMRKLDSTELATARLTQDTWDDMYEPTGDPRCSPYDVYIRYLPPTEFTDKCRGCRAHNDPRPVNLGGVNAIGYFTSEKLQQPFGTRTRSVITILDTETAETNAHTLVHEYLHYIGTCSALAYMGDGVDDHSDSRRFPCSHEDTIAGLCAEPGDVMTRLVETEEFKDILELFKERGY